MSILRGYFRSSAKADIKTKVLKMCYQPSTMPGVFTYSAVQICGATSGWVFAAAVL